MNQQPIVRITNVATIPTDELSPPESNNQRYLAPYPAPSHTGKENPLPEMTLYRANYSGKEVMEIEIDGINCMRRLEDSWINVTQLLKVAGYEKSKRIKVLEKEVFNMKEHEKVQGGYGKYQGTWIPFDVGVRIAKRHGVYDRVKLLLDVDIKYAMNLPEKKLPHGATVARRSTSVHNPITKVIKNKVKPLPRSKSDAVKPGSNNNNSIQEKQKKMIQLTKEAQMEKVKNLWLRNFLEGEGTDNYLPDSLLNTDTGLVNVPLDTHGHTAIHYAASMGRSKALTQLIAIGYLPNTISKTGITPLMRCVIYSHSYQLKNFDWILAELECSLLVEDNSHRNVLHHCVIAGNQRHHYQASYYYLTKIVSSIRGLGSKCHKIINGQDSNLDTPCHLAARLEYFDMVKLFYDNGANLQIKNSSFLSVLDYLPTHVMEKYFLQGKEPEQIKTQDQGQDQIQNENQERDQAQAQIQDQKQPHSQSYSQSHSQLQSQAQIQSEEQEPFQIEYTSDLPSRIESDVSSPEQALKERIALDSKMDRRKGDLISGKFISYKSFYKKLMFLLLAVELFSKEMKEEHEFQLHQKDILIEDLKNQLELTNRKLRNITLAYNASSAVLAIAKNTPSLKKYLIPPPTPQHNPIRIENESDELEFDME
ncbi:apses-domain-containing protein [Neoconidiobolus thromboides FSU 785]|nr:apses-domain-containing protein [Neoconidiobolus thromboides FSU 785]